MPKRNKRKFFGKSNKSKTAKSNRNASSSDERQHESESEEKCDNNASARQNKEEGDEDEDEETSESTADTSLVSNDSAPAMGQLESVAASEIDSIAISAMSKVEHHQQHKATITLKVIQFIGEVPKETRDDESEFMRQRPGEVLDVSAEINEIENDDNVRDNKSIIDDTQIAEENLPLHSECDVAGDVPKLDHNKEEENENENSDGARRHQRERSFDDNYRVESPKQICAETNHGIRQRTKRHAMFIQEISESSSSEEVKQILDIGATALEMKVIDTLEETIVAPSPRNYRVDSPASSDENIHLKVVAHQDDVVVQEISESSSSESVKNEILASISRQQPPQPKFDAKPSKIINIKELPSEENVASSGKMSPLSAANASSSKITITQFEFKAEKKLNKAEEAILEALYGNKSYLQTPNLPLDVISEEGSDCGSDIDKQPSNKVISDELDDDVFLPPSSAALSKKPPSSARKRSDQTLRAVAEQPQLISTKIIETESNIPESCKSWETTPGDNELQAELVYLTSTSSSATDLSERGDITDTDDIEDSSEGTETNSLLENVSVPSLDNFEDDKPIEMRFCQPSPLYTTIDYFQEMNEQKLPDILEEDEPQSLEIIESQQQIENVNKELQHLVSEHEESQSRQFGERVSESQVDEVQQQEDPLDDVNIEKPKQKEDNLALENVPETICDSACDKKKILSDVNADKDLSNRVTPTSFKRKNSSDSSSSANSQCTIIRQSATGDQHQHINPLRDLCMQTLDRNGFELGDNKDMNGEGTITVHKKLNSLSRNAPQIPIINELELHYKYDNDDLEGRENHANRVITILQVPPEMNSTVTATSFDKRRWHGLQSSQIPNLLLALSPLQSTYMMSSQDSNTASADVLLDMHKKFVERRAYHEADEPEMVENSGNSKTMIVNVNDSQLEDGYFADRENSVENIIPNANKSPEISGSLNESGSSVANCDNQKKNENASKLTSRSENKPATVKSAQGDIKMNSIRNLLLRDEFFKNTFVDADRDDDSASNNAEGFEVKKYELENELQRLDNERRELEEELRNLRSMQHFKREEFLFNEKKFEEKIKNEFETLENRRHSGIKNSNDDFAEFVNSNEKLQQELYNEWQDKVLERYERKLQKTIKITSITETIHHDDQSGLAASEKLRFVPLENEFMTKLRERRKRLSLQLEEELNSSTESLHHQNEESKKTDAKQSPHKAEHIPAHLHEFLKYYEEELAQSKNSDESGESRPKRLQLPLLIGLIGVSMCLCGFYIGKHLITQRSKLF